MTLTVPAWAEQAARSFAPPDRSFPTPGALAQHIDPPRLVRGRKGGTVQTPALDLIDRELVRLLDTPDGRLIISMPPQEGKALALDTPIPTPTGWTTMGDLRPGDRVIGGDGHPCTVTWTSPVWTGRDCYAVTTGDGERIVADAAHEWVARLTQTGPTRTVDTTVLARPRRKNAQIVTAPGGLRLPEADLPLDPYVLGVWLGDGTTRAAAITSHPDDTAVRDRIRSAGLPVRDLGRMRYSLAPEDGGSRRSPARAALVAAGVMGDKRVPAAYLRGSRAQRLALLQGLVDSDGYVMPKGQVEFCSTSRALAEGVRELVYTLGAKAVMTTGRATLNGRDCGPKYRVRFYLAEAAHLPRKAGRCKDSSVATVRYVKAEQCESVPTVCIEVDSPDHTFLAGRTMLPTHNSTRSAGDFPVWVLTQNPDARVVTASYAQSLANRNGRAIRRRITEHPELGLRIAPDNGAVSDWAIDGHAGGVLSVGIGSSLTGRPADLLIIDDPISNRAQADSKTYRDRAWDWWTDVASTRLAPGAPVVLILTRWHHDDLAGRLLAAEDGHTWRVVNIPAQAVATSPGLDPLGRAEGEYMVSARGRSRAQWDAIRVRSGPRTWASLYQGSPTPDVGGLFPVAGWARYDRALWVERGDGSRVVPEAGADPDVELVQSWDFTFKDTKGSDYVVGQVWMRRGPRAYLLDQVRRRAGFAESVQMMRDLTARWPQAVTKLVEDKANGPAILNAVRGQVGGLVPVEPEGSKYARAAAITPFTAARDVVLPDPLLVDGTTWVTELTEEARDFPAAAHDDTVDAMSQAVHRLLLVPIIDGDTIDVSADAEGDDDLDWTIDY